MKYLVLTLGMILLLIDGAVAQVLTTATFIGIEAADVYDSIRFGQGGIVWAGMPGPFDRPFECRCGTPAKPARIRLRLEGKGGVHIVVGEPGSRRLLSTTDVQIVGLLGTIAAWDVNGPVIFYFSPGSNLRGVFVDETTLPPMSFVPVIPPAAPTGLRIQKDPK